MRNVGEARAAYEGGAAVIDIKEPRAGALGAASEATIAQIVAFIDGRRPVTAALGELKEISNGKGLPGVAAVKIGLAGLGGSDWCEKLTKNFSLAAGRSRGLPEKDSAGFPRRLGTEPIETELVLAAYADWHAAEAPEPLEVMEVTMKLGLSWMLLDTWDKSSGDLLDCCSESELISLLAKARQSGLQVVLAGRLQGESLCRVSQIGPDLIGVRSAVCTGGRDGQVSVSLVELAVESILRQDQPFPAKMAGL